MKSNLQNALICLLAMLPVILPAQNNKGTKDWTILASYTIPGKASGLAYDGAYLYYGIYGSNGDEVYQVDPATGNAQLLFSSPEIGDSYGMTHDGTNLWITDHVTSSSIPATAEEYDMSGNQVSQFDLPDHYMSGIAYDEGDFWVATYYPNPGTIYKVDNSGNILAQFPSPEEQPWDICVQEDSLWVVDYDADMIYKLDQSGNILESHQSENIKPSGIVYDGQYLWYVDGQISSQSTLYKVDLGGAGTPAIDIPVDTYNFGTVTVGDSAVWNMTINNNGTGELTVNGLVIQNAVPIFNWTAFPQTIAPGNSTQIPLIYKPSENGSLNTIVSVQSDDPINPEVDVTLTGNAVVDGPSIFLPEAAHNYGQVRLNSTSRWFMSIANTGNQTLEVTDIQIDDPAFYLDGSVSLPMNISVLDTIDVGVWFWPDQPGTITATMTITNNDPAQNPFEVPLEGSSQQLDYPIGDNLWNYQINTGYDNSVKAIAHLPDINDDGIEEVIVCSEDNYVRCFNGNSSGTADLLWANEAGTVAGQNDLAIIQDIDNDGYQDVITGMAWGVRAIIALSGKTGQQIWIHDTHEYGDGGWVYQVWTKYDYNDDGVMDVLAATGNDGNNTGPKRVYCLDGLTGNSIWETMTGGPVFSVVGVDDFNNDNKPDVIGGASNYEETQGKVYGIDGETGNIEWTYDVLGTSVWAVEQIDDANNDGIMDIVAGDFAGAYYLLDATNGSVINQGSVGNSIILRFEKMDDVNGDNHPDILIAYSGTNCIVIDGITGQNIWLQSLADKVWVVDRIQDITGDGINDVVAGTLYQSNYCYFLDGTDGTELESISFSTPLDAIAATPDIVGDGSWEMVAGGRDGTVSVFSGGVAIQNPDINVPVDNHDYGAVPLGETETWDMEIQNVGNADLIINEIDIPISGPFYYDIVLPQTISGGGSLLIPIVFEPEDIGPVSITATIMSNDPDEPDVPVTLNGDGIVGIPENVENGGFEIYPNPLTGRAKISFTLDQEQQVSISILDITANSFDEILSGLFPKGNHEFNWDSKEIENGNYLIRISGMTISEVRKITIMK